MRESFPIYVSSFAGFEGLLLRNFSYLFAVCKEETALMSMRLSLASLLRKKKIHLSNDNRNYDLRFQ